MRSVLITGTSTGIGQATAVTLAARGWRVFATMRNLKKRGLLEQALKEAGVRDGEDAEQLRQGGEVPSQEDGGAPRDKAALGLRVPVAGGTMPAQELSEGKPRTDFRESRNRSRIAPRGGTRRSDA